MAQDRRALELVDGWPVQAMAGANSGMIVVSTYRGAADRLRGGPCRPQRTMSPTNAERQLSSARHHGRVRQNRTRGLTTETACSSRSVASTRSIDFVRNRRIQRPSVRHIVLLEPISQSVGLERETRVLGRVTG
jgi:hypothetical protein